MQWRLSLPSGVVSSGVRGWRGSGDKWAEQIEAEGKEELGTAPLNAKSEDLWREGFGAPDGVDVLGCSAGHGTSKQAQWTCQLVVVVVGLDFR